MTTFRAYFARKDDFSDVQEPQTRAAIEETFVREPGALVTEIRTSGYATEADGGGGLYKWVAAEPSHALKVQSADGAWWELIPDPAGLSVRQGGALGGGTDDATAIQAVIDSGLSNSIIFPEDTYSVGTPISTNAVFWKFIGGGRNTVIQALSGSALSHVLIVSHAGGTLRDIQVDGLNGDATDTVVFQNAGSCLIENARAIGYSQFGFRFDNAAGPGGGNNNGLIMNSCGANGADGSGTSGVAVPTFQGDNNDIIINGLQCNNHTSDGMMIRGHGWRVVGGNYFSNGGNGIKVGDTSTDGVSFSTGHVFINPWLESNTGDGIEFNKALRSIAWHSAVAGQDDVVDTDGRNVKLSSNTTGSSGRLRVQTGTDSRRLEILNFGFVLGGGTDTDRDLALIPKNDGVVTGAVSGGTGFGSSGTRWGKAFVGDIDSDGASIVFSNLPTSDPVNAGQLWNDAGTLKVSSG